MGEFIFFGLFGLVVLWVAFSFLTKRGRGMMFGGTIIKSWDGVAGKRKIVTARVKVHAVDSSTNARIVGLELSNSTFGSYQMVPISLSATEALALARLIEQAANYSSANET